MQVKLFALFFFILFYSIINHNFDSPKLLNIDEFQREIKTIDDLDAENLSIIE